MLLSIEGTLQAAWGADVWQLAFCMQSLFQISRTLCLGTYPYSIISSYEMTKE